MRVRIFKAGGGLALLAAALMAGCGDDDGRGLAGLAPPDAPLYAELTVHPDGDQTSAIESVSDRLAGIEDPGGALAAVVDAALAGGRAQVSFADDIEPWLGDHAAIFVRSFDSPGAAGGAPDLAVALETGDPEAAREFVDEVAAADPGADETRSYGGFEYLYSRDDGGVAGGIVDEALVIGSEESFMVAVDAASGISLGDSPEYSERAAALAEDRIATAFIEPAAAIEAATASEDLEPGDARLLRPLLGGPLSSPVALGLSASEDSASLELATTFDGGEVDTGSALLAELPGGSWLGAAVPQLGPALERGLDEIGTSGLRGAGALERGWRTLTGVELRPGVTGWLGDSAAFVEGTGVPGFTAGVIAETADPEGPREFVAAARRIVEQSSGLRSAAPPPGADYGFSLGLPGLGGGAEAGVFDDRLVAAVGASAAEVTDPATRLGDEPRFEAALEALGEGFAPALYLHLPSALEVAERGGAGEGLDLLAARPYLEAIESLMIGSDVTGGIAISRLTLALAQ